ncbi:MAG TPA: Clp protease N-terminal domain-containing protein [Acidimicrobiales bacterium]|nr:Clp protease N-terminal domain-containing protein [Acidimicrobiales bacterium]
MRFLDPADVLVLAAELEAVEAPELSGRVDLVSLRAALEAVEQAGPATPADAAASLFVELSRRRPVGGLGDQLAWLAACQLLAVNGTLVPEPPPDAPEVLRRAGGGELAVGGLAAWLDRLCSAPTRETGEQMIRRAKRAAQSAPRGRTRPMSGRFTAQARAVMAMAQTSALELQHNFIGTEHLLLGLTRCPGPVADVLASAGVTADAARELVGITVGPGQAAMCPSPPFTPRAKKVLELSLRESLQLGDHHVGPEHILLGIIREGAGVAAQALEQLGGDPAAVRQQVLARRVEAMAAEVTSGELRARLRHDLEHLLERNAHLEEEVDRLRSLLLSHHIDPATGEVSA